MTAFCSVCSDYALVSAVTTKTPFANYVRSVGSLQKVGMFKDLRSKDWVTENEVLWTIRIFKDLRSKDWVTENEVLWTITSGKRSISLAIHKELQPEKEWRLERLCGRINKPREKMPGGVFDVSLDCRALLFPWVCWFYTRVWRMLKRKIVSLACSSVCHGFLNGLL